MTPLYLAAVERAFLARAGRGLMLSPRDIELVARWFRAGLPAEVVCAGIDRALENGPARVRSLAYVAGAVEDAAKAWRARETGKAARSEPTDAALGASFDALIVRVEAAARAQLHLGLRAVAERCAGRLHALRGAEDPVAALQALEAETVEEALTALEASEREGLEEAVDAELADERRRADPEAWAETRRVQVRRRVRNRLGLPPLALEVGCGW